MGYEKLMPAETALWQRWREQFPVTERLVYLNHAAVAPLSRRAAEAMKWLADDALEFGSLHYDQWLAAYKRLRQVTAELIGAEPAEIAIVKNTSEGIATVALGLDWQPGDRIVAFREEFPANQYPWQRLESKGVRIEWLSCTDCLDRIDEAARGAKLLAVSFVQYLSGFRADLNAIGEICRRRGCFFFVDAIQGLGAFPLNVRSAHIDALAADGHKWLLGPEGCGVLYVRREVQDRVEPTEFGWTNVAGFNDYSNRDMALRGDAGRYEPGTLNTVGIFGLAAAVELVLEIGVDEIAAAVQALGDRIAAGAAAQGYEILGERTHANGAGIVSLRRPDRDSALLWRDLRDRGFLAANRQGWLRVSPHFYVSPDDIDRFLSEL